MRKDMKKKTAVLMLITILLSIILPACGAPVENMDSQAVVYDDFRDIPGVTQDEIDAVEALLQEYDSFTYGVLSSTETFMRLDGKYGGYSALVCDWLSQLFGVEFKLEIYNWGELYSVFTSGGMDFCGELTATDERREIFYMTDTFTEREIVSFRLRGSDSFNEIARKRPLVFAFFENTTTIDAVMSSSSYEIEPYYIQSEAEAIELMREGVIDAFIGEEHTAAAFPDDIITETLFPVLYSPISFSSAKAELEPIIKVIDKYLQNGAMNQLMELYIDGRQQYDSYKLYSRLTSSERLYLYNHREGRGTVSVVSAYNNYPISFYNEKERQWQGIAIDILDEITEICGIEFEIINGTDSDWVDILPMLEDGEAAMITELIYSKDREGRFIWTYEPYSTDNYAILSLAETEDISVNKILHSSVGLLSGTGYADTFREWFPDHQNTVEYSNPDSAFDALESGEIELFMASRNILLSATNYHENPGFKANLVFDKTYDSAFGFNIDEVQLCGIISKAITHIDTKTIADRWTRKTYDYRGKLAQQQVPYLLALSLSLVCVGVLLLILFIRNKQMNKKLEKTVRERTAELVVVSQAKGEFLSRMSHEIRTPLNAIIGMAQIARNSAELESPKTAKAVDEIIRASDHLLGLINDVLDISKIEAGKFDLTNKPFYITDSISDVENIILPRCQEKGLDLSCTVETPEEVAVMGDKLHLNQVLINLLGNAVKFTPDGGYIRLSVITADIADELITYRFSVQDSGIGMSEEQMSRLFKAFEQADANTASRYGGTGLGLAISQSLVGQMGGEITVLSEQGKGSIFSFEINLSICDGAAVSPTDEDDEVDLTGRHVLIVEDLEINRIIIKELLGGTNAEFDEAADGVEAVEAFARSPVDYYDLIFMDVQMPNMDGYEATREIRSLDRADASSVPIIAMTANAYKEDIDKALEAGMNGHVAKPIDVEAVKKAMREMINN